MSVQITGNLIVQQLVEANNKDNVKAPRCRPFVGEPNDDQGILCYCNALYNIILLCYNSPNCTEI